MTKKVLHKSGITPTNLKSVFNVLASLYSKLIKNHRGKIRMIISEDSKGIELRFRIPTVELSSSMKVLIRLCIDKFIARDKYLQLRDEEES